MSIVVNQRTKQRTCYAVDLFAVIRAVSGGYEPIRQKTLRPKLTQAEGFILGVGAKMFTIAGPVIVYGTVASVVYGIIYWIATLF